MPSLTAEHHFTRTHSPSSSAPYPRAVATHHFSRTAAGQGAGFDEVLPEEAFAGVGAVQQDVGAEEGSVP